MRVTLFFVAFGFLFAFLVPMLIGTLMKDDEQSAWRPQQTVLPQTGAERKATGKIVESCDTEGYEYLVTGDGFPYVQKKNTPYIAALIDDRVVILHVDGNSNQATPDLPDKRLPDDMARLSSVLSTCIESNRSPAQTEILFQEKK